MNYIKKLQLEIIEKQIHAKNCYKQLLEMEAYYCSDKFSGKENDYAHVSTDVLVKIHELKMELILLINDLSY